MKKDPAGIYRDPSYVDVPRFVSYAYQLESILKLNPSSVLEIGIGPGIVSGFLASAGITTTTCDIVPSLGPDCLGDVRSLPFADNQFDVVAAFEILEHMPFEDLARGLSELHRVSREFVVISVPYSCASIDGVLRINVWRLSKVLSLGIRVPYFFRRHRLPPAHGDHLEQSIHHYWEMGRRGHSGSLIREILGRFFTIEAAFQPREHSYHYFFVLRKIRLQTLSPSRGS